jgi:hypothetical protein
MLMNEKLTNEEYNQEQFDYYNSYLEDQVDYYING